MISRMAEPIDVKKLKAARAALYLSQRELSDRTGLSRERIARLERAKTPQRVYPQTLRKLADTLGVSPEDLKPP